MIEKIRVKPRTKKAELMKTSSLDFSVSADKSTSHATLAIAPTPAFVALRSSTTFASISL